MPPVTARTIGGPGGGKTTRLLNIQEMCLEKVVADPMMIGFVSFTRAARREASSRAADKFNVKVTDLEKHGWYRTLHSVCYRCLKVAEGELLTGTAQDSDWLRGVLDADVRLPQRHTDDDYLVLTADYSSAGKALSFWDTARNRLCPVERVWDYAQAIDQRVPDLDFCLGVVERYEQGKREDGRLDFCDLLMRFAGKRWSGCHEAPFEDVRPDGEFPVLPVYFHDEMQDCSLLTSLVFRRLTRHSTYAYLAGDDRQALYAFAGGDGTLFARWPVLKEEVLPVSYRCDEAVLNLADSIIERSHPRRDFKPANKGGEVLRASLEEAMAAVQPGEDTLVLARTNEQARLAASLLDDRLTPWAPLKGGGSANAPARTEGVAALLTLARGGMVGGEAWWRVTQLLPARTAGVPLFDRGAKKRFEDEEQRRWFASTLPMLDLGGATEGLKQLIGSGKVVDLLEAPAARLYRCGERHGVEALGKPACRVGTIHGAKGMEAQSVVIVNDMPYPVQQAIEEPEGLDDERRVAYVAVSRAMHKVTIATPDDGEPFPEL